MPRVLLYHSLSRLKADQFREIAEEALKIENGVLWEKQDRSFLTLQGFPAQEESLL